jgi:hypothetical protein
VGHFFEPCFQALQVLMTPSVSQCLRNSKYFEGNRRYTVMAAMRATAATGNGLTTTKVAEKGHVHLAPF